MDNITTRSSSHRKVIEGKVVGAFVVPVDLVNVMVLFITVTCKPIDSSICLNIII